ncbi:taspase, threonine aspartase, 1 [Rhizophlyctis rosea]|uniref:Taspase, threonine aspartase, 1 n=1 Tax=Rhizophlyctis rosea TaxID=64517 RepID=A0AAD5X6M1_9FUNG|nr:taspase, threonine aspartase, 1 [Rhizophlyctis rosea]
MSSPQPTYTPCIAIHAGAGYHSPSSESALQTLLCQALTTAISLLRSPLPNNTALQAVTTALRILEDSPLTNAGTGSNLSLAGTVECDASIMDGSDGSFGAVGAVSGLKNPVMGAKEVMEGDRKGVGLLGRVMPMVLCGEGARVFCEDRGIECVDPEDLVTEEARRRWEKYVQHFEDAKRGASDRKRPLAVDTPTSSSSSSKRPRASLPLDIQESLLNDTIGAVAMDSTGTIISAVSSGGIALKYPGRIGEAACYGAGVWALNPNNDISPQIGIGISVSGTGEQIMRTLVAKDCAEVLNDPALTTTDVPNFLRRFVEEHFLKQKVLGRYDERNVGFIVLRVDPGGGGEEGTEEEMEDGTKVDEVENADTNSGESVSCEIWYAHTTQSFSVGWMSAGDRKPTVKMSRKRRSKHLVIEGRPL